MSFRSMIDYFNSFILFNYLPAKHFLSPFLNSFGILKLSWNLFTIQQCKMHNVVVRLVTDSFVMFWFFLCVFYFLSALLFLFSFLLVSLSAVSPQLRLIGTWAHLVSISRLLFILASPSSQGWSILSGSGGNKPQDEEMAGLIQEDMIFNVQKMQKKQEPGNSEQEPANRKKEHWRQQTVHSIGTSLLQEVVYLVSQGADPNEIGLMNIDEQLPVLEYPQPGLDIIKELMSPRLIKSHLPYRFLPSGIHNGEAKVIYMARNPKDLVVSYYQFHRSLRTMSYRGTFQEFCQRFMNEKLGYGSWFEHVLEFWEHRMDSNVLFLKYEDMYKDLGALVEQLAWFLGVSCDKAQHEALVESCNQLIEQCCSSEVQSVGRVSSFCFEPMEVYS
ncbi:sulfotransferase 4A1 isoform X2 [Nerophis lumbriciformis]|uniref:sulfotransferase 4A1 isoform X2 n=1 Tax=Nerophis lumbriciformis TaxID=546530 RepID=UPI003BABD36A